MARSDLLALFKLHQVDAAIVDIRKRAAALDPGREITVEIEALKKASAPIIEQAHKLQAELTDAELTQKGIDEKIAKFDKELYGGKIVNPREVETMQKEIEALKRNRSDLDGRILELWELAPKAKEKAEAYEKQIQAKKHELAEHQKHALELKSQLEADFKRLAASRAAAAANIDPALIKKYNDIRDKAGGVGMAEINREGRCQRCNTMLPERTLVAVREDRLTICESCHRILFMEMLD